MGFYASVEAAALAWDITAASLRRCRKLNFPEVSFADLEQQLDALKCVISQTPGNEQIAHMPIPPPNAPPIIGAADGLAMEPPHAPPAPPPLVGQEGGMLSGTPPPPLRVNGAEEGGVPAPGPESPGQVDDMDVDHDEGGEHGALESEEEAQDEGAGMQAAAAQDPVVLPPAPDGDMEDGPDDEGPSVGHMEVQSEEAAEAEQA
jgi:hypothetical protein